jgi:hypothetical protein
MLHSWINRILVLIAATALAGCSGFSSANSGSPTPVSTFHGKPRHWITIHPGQSRTYPPGALAAPLTFTCPGGGGLPGGGGGLQVIRSWHPGMRALYGGSLDFAVSSTGVVHVGC